MTTTALPTRRQEAWRYADLDALARVWPLADAPERVEVGPGEARVLFLPALDATAGVAVRQIDIDIAQDGRCDLFALVAGTADYGRLEIRTTLHGRAHFELGAAIIGTANQTLEIVTDVTHAEPAATSNQIVRNILGGQATGSFLGKVAVARDAQQTDATQSVKAMLLDRRATANAKPELEIFADDVKCAHGATVGELDKAALFYLASRGLPPAAAKRLMLHAFVVESYRNAAENAAREDIEKHALLALERVL